jgi:hypothetical protein
VQQVTIIIFFPKDQPLAQLQCLLAVEVLMLMVIYSNNACKTPIFLNAGEQMLVTSGCYVQLLFLLVPVGALMSRGKPNVSLLIYVSGLAIIVQVLIIIVKTYGIVKSLMKKKKKEADLKLEQDSFKTKIRQSSDLAELDLESESPSSEKVAS